MKKLRPDLTHERLLEVLSYDPLTGIFRWRISRGPVSRRKAGDVAGCSSDYVQICIDYRHYKAHRLAWFYVHGKWPPDEIDHKNRKRRENPIANLRLATRHQNGRNLSVGTNNTSGAIGVAWSKDRQRWIAYITVNKKTRRIGRYTEKSAAIAARRSAELRLFGEFAP